MAREEGARADDVAALRLAQEALAHHPLRDEIADLRRTGMGAVRRAGGLALGSTWGRRASL